MISLGVLSGSKNNILCTRKHQMFPYNTETTILVDYFFLKATLEGVGGRYCRLSPAEGNTVPGKNNFFVAFFSP